MTCRSLTWTSLLAASAVCGCATRGNVEVLESRLRVREDRFNQLEGQLASAQAKLTAARRESDALRAQLEDRGEKTILPEQAGVLYRVTGIQINKLLTGGLDRDDRPGDDVLTALFYPHDADGQLLKLSGTILMEVLDLAKPNGRQRIGVWSFDADESRTHWHSGFLGSGYWFRLPWQQAPENSELLLHVRLTTPDGRQFDTTQQIRITPPAKVRIAEDVSGERLSGAITDKPAEPELLRKIAGRQELKPPRRLAPDLQRDSKTPVEPLPLRTSDSWTDETLPQFR